jgi:uncharacterized protein (TIGR03435 family)
MLQKLLEDRFKLQVHREPRTTQVYALEGRKGRAQNANGERSALGRLRSSDRDQRDHRRCCGLRST